MDGGVNLMRINENEAIADPGPLGTAAFALTTFCLSLINAGFVGAKTEPIVLVLALVFGGSVQIMAGMWEFKKNNTFGATVFSSYGAFWLCFGVFVLGIGKWGWFDPNELNIAGSVAIFLIGFTILTLYLWIASFALHKAMAITFTVLIVALIGLDVHALTGSAGANRIGGYFGLLAAFGAYYMSAAGVINACYKKTVLPLGQFKR